MSAPLLATKLYIPPPRPGIVLRLRLFERLNQALLSGCKFILISAPAGFGKSTLVSEWLASLKIPIAWLSLDERDRDPARFITYLVAAIQKVKPGIGVTLQPILQSPQPLQIENILTLLINELLTIEEKFLIVLDDYHSVDSPEVDQSLDFLIDHQPPHMHLVITTREDPDLPLARLRTRGQCTELRAADLRFSESESAEFLNRMMNLNLSEKDVIALETRTEGWIAGLQMAAISLQGVQDAENFIQSFTGSHRFVMDYLLEEVLSRQPENIQAFLQKTSILDRMCGPLCDAILQEPSGSGQNTLEYLERVNLFIIPQDNERRWYRYHHLFASLLRKRLGQNLDSENIARLNKLASEWYEHNNLLLEAFRHATSADDVDHAVRLIQSDKMPLHIRGTATMILDWLLTLPASILNAQPILWWKQAQMLVLNGRFIEAEEKLMAAEAALAASHPSPVEVDHTDRDLIGKIAAIRSNWAVGLQNADEIFEQAHCALENLHPNNFSDRSSVIRVMGFAYLLQGNRAAAGRSFSESLSLANRTGDKVEPLLATFGLAQIKEKENHLSLANELYQQVLPKLIDFSILNAGVIYLGMARICYQWNNLDDAEKFGEQSLTLARQFSQIKNRFVMSEMFLARVKLARGDREGAMSLLKEAEQVARQHNFPHQVLEIIACKVLIFLRQGNLIAAEELVQQVDLPLCRASVLLAQGKPSAALAALEQYRQQVEAKGWQDEGLQTIALQSVAFSSLGDKKKALKCLEEAFAMAEPGGFIRLFVDLGEPMRLLILDFRARIEKQPGDRAQLLASYVDKILAAFAQPESAQESKTSNLNSQLIEPLSPREQEVLLLICKGLSNHEICERLFLALDTVKGHNRRIFEKLQVHRRTEAIIRARELGLY